MGLEVERDFVELGHIFLEYKRQDNTFNSNKKIIIMAGANCKLHMLKHFLLVKTQRQALHSHASRISRGRSSDFGVFMSVKLWKQH